MRPRVPSDYPRKPVSWPSQAALDKAEEAARHWARSVQRRETYAFSPFMRYLVAEYRRRFMDANSRR